MPEPTRMEMLLEKNRQTLMDLSQPEEVKQVARDMLLCDLHRWMEAVVHKHGDELKKHDDLKWQTL